MNKLNDYAYIKHIDDAIKQIKGFIAGISFEQFDQNDMMISAVIRKLEIIGEAANKVSSNLKEQNKQIPWRIIIDLRNFLIHQYFGVDVKSIWDTLNEDLPPLETKIEEILKNLSG